MSAYQVIARRYRPQTFAEILGQDAIITTLKNAILRHRLAHAYLFCGSRGTGKTSLARVFAKALNCQSPTADGEPCNICSTCKEITSGNSLDVLEIDGASHRGIDDIRQINDTVSYSTSSGKFKIYIIDEVHMLTKEAFNALLKTLEEPPPQVKFFFATTEPHKVLPTILSRCQRFNLNRIPLDIITQKLNRIAQEQNRNINEQAVKMIAVKAEGAFRDAESLLDQIFAFHDGDINAETVSEVLGLMPQDILFALDIAGKDNNLNVVFEVVEQLYTQGKDLSHFIEMLTDHFRSLLLIKLSGKDAPFLTLSQQEREKYSQSAALYTREQCLTAIDLLVEAQTQIRFSPSPRIALEALLLRILQLHQRISIDFLVRRLQELEKAVANQSSGVQTPISTPVPDPLPTPTSSPSTTSISIPPSPMPSPKAITPASLPYSMTEDPTPTLADIGKKPAAAKVKLVTTKPEPAPAPPPASPPEMLPPALPPVPIEVVYNSVITEIHAIPPTTTISARTPENAMSTIKKQSRYDTLL
ncbi:MAG: DNA polymerase III subunit gamma/tau, partial [Parachlamydiaceae bacterium]|nr:DNA polymerase III subunit gamma/tau [Parachlamydiaceae bacterium]